MKKIALFFIALSLMACNSIDPVEYNDALVASTEAATRAQDAFANSLGTAGDTMRVNFDKMNTVTDKAIADIKALEEHEDGKEYKAAALQYLNDLKAQNMNLGRQLMIQAQQINKGTLVPTEALISEFGKQAMDFDAMAIEANQKIRAAQEKYAAKTGIKLEVQPSSKPQE